MIEAFASEPLRLLERLEGAVTSGRLAVPPGEADLLSERLESLVPYLPLLQQLGTRTALASFVATVVLLRRREHERDRPELVWTGPEPRRGRARRTSVVMQDLLERARQEVFIAGYSFEGGGDLLEPLQRGMRDHGVRARVVIDCSWWKVYEATPSEEILDAVVRSFWSETWRGAQPRPDLYYDPRTLGREPPRRGAAWFPNVSMHAKCVVVDRCEVLVGSANFTARAQTRNIEVGVAMHDPDLADALLNQWQEAMREGTLRKV